MKNTVGAEKLDGAETKCAACKQSKNKNRVT